jgi:hypothetical protein
MSHDHDSDGVSRRRALYTQGKELLAVTDQPLAAG